LKHSHLRSLIFALAALCLVLLCITAFGGWKYYSLNKAFVATENSLASTTTAYNATVMALADASTTNVTLSDALLNEKARNDSFYSQINNLSSSVGTLTKLSETDPQLLQKYSKVYFLNENYVPSSLATISPSSEYDSSRTLQFQTQAYPFLANLLNDAKSQGVDLLVASAYRSFASQVSLKSSYKVTYGSGANTFSADQGYSEHQLGTALDFTTASLSGGLTGFDKTPAYTWLLQNAYKYGFELSYPKGNSYYIYEPWHWRFVGKNLARKLHDDNQNFYNLDQRTINGYLISLFDN
jgi:LAS superfamily LD-carboxypeptidase LdcB